MKLTITDLGLDNLFGTADDTVLFMKNYSATTVAWVQNTNIGEAPIIALGNNVRFAYSAISVGSEKALMGNFFDAADFTVDVGTVSTPESSANLALLVMVIVGGCSIYKRVKI